MGYALMVADVTERPEQPLLVVGPVQGPYVVCEWTGQSWEPLYVKGPQGVLPLPECFELSVEAVAALNAFTGPKFGVEDEERGPDR